MTNIQVREPEEIVKKADDLGKEFSRQVKTHQLRNFYAGVTQIRQDWRQNKDALAASAKLIMLQPKLAYAAGRQSSIKRFVEEINGEISSTRATIKALAQEISKQPEKQQELVSMQAVTLDNFFALIEGIVAYHKFYGGD